MTGAPAPTSLGELPGAPAAGASPPDAPPGATPDAPFQSALESEWARTASAEGHQDNPPGASAEAPPRQHTASGESESGESAVTPNHTATVVHAAHTPHPPAHAHRPQQPGAGHADPATTAQSSQGTRGAAAPLDTPAPRQAPPVTSGGAADATAQTALASPPNGSLGATGAPSVAAAKGPAAAEPSTNTQLASSEETPQGAPAAGTPDTTEATDRNADAAGAGSPANAQVTSPAVSERTPASTSQTPSSPPGTQPTAASNDTPNPSHSPLTPPAAQAPSGTAGGAPETAPGASARSTNAGKASAAARAGSASLHSTLSGIQRSDESSTGNGSAHGEKQSTPAASSSNDSGKAHDTLWVPDSTTQTPNEGSAAGAAAGASPEALGVAYDSVGDPALASDVGSLADLGALDLGGGLAQAVETLSATIELAARQGVSQARIALHPAELGAIRIHLSQTADGLLARITADTPAAAQALASGHADLHQSLGQLGLGSVRLHIAHGGAAQGEAGSGAEGHEAGRRAGARGGEAPLPRSLASAHSTLAPAAAADAQDPAEAEPQTPMHSGRALDVLV